MLNKFELKVSLLISITTTRLPTLVTVAGYQACLRFTEFFTAQIRNPHTRRSYARAVGEFLAWCQGAGITALSQIQPLHVAA